MAPPLVIMIIIIDGNTPKVVFIQMEVLDRMVYVAVRRIHHPHTYRR